MSEPTTTPMDMDDNKEDDVIINDEKQADVSIFIIFIFNFALKHILKNRFKLHAYLLSNLYIQQYIIYL